MTAAPEALEAGDTIPQAAPLHPAPDTAQVTPLSAESFVTVAVSCCVRPTCTLAVVADRLTLMGGGAVVPPPEPVFPWELP